MPQLGHSRKEEEKVEDTESAPLYTSTPSASLVGTEGRRKGREGGGERERKRERERERVKNIFHQNVCLCLSQCNLSFHNVLPVSNFFVPLDGLFVLELSTLF